MTAARTLETGTSHLLARVEDRVATLTLNRPERRNAFSTEMLEGLGRALEEIELARDVGCVVLTGAGGAFSAGGDVKGMEEGNAASAENAAKESVDARIHGMRRLQRITSGRLYALAKPVIAALPGAAAGGGFSLALACDLRVASENALLVTSFARIGFSGDWGGTFLATQIVGSAKARELYYLSERIDAREALRLGLLNRVVTASELAAAVREMALRIARGPTVAYRLMKENLNRAAEGASMLECLDLEASNLVASSLTEDHREATRAFVERREPAFRGR
jgi:2-(1,2-epoxy-1,2-dihydrophenyl)acetyl-CoA isomerase